MEKAIVLLQTMGREVEVWHAGIKLTKHSFRSTLLYLYVCYSFKNGTIPKQ